MPRYGRVPKRKIAPDAVYGSLVVAKFINKMMLDGKKEKCENIFYKAMTEVKTKSGKEPIEVFVKAMENIAPLLEVKPRRVGGATYQIPIEVRSERGISIAMRWIRNFARVKKGKPMEIKLADELLDAFKGEGPAVKKKEDTHKMAEANKAFAHYRW